MKILVTGSGTLVGNTISTKLSKKYHVLASYNKHAPLNLKKNKKVSICKIDLSKKLIFNKKFDVLVHCASVVPAKNSKKKVFDIINFGGFKKLIELCSKNKCKKIILLSTLSVYGKITSKSITEKTRANKPDYYGQSKIKMEKLLIKYCNSKKVDGLILRLPGIVGYKSKHNFLSNSLTIIKSRKSLNINNPHLKYNNLFHVDNLADIIFKSISKKIGIKIYNLGCTQPLEFIKIFKIIFKKLKIKEKIKIKNKFGGFNIKLKSDLKRNYSLYTTRRALYKFINDNLN